jgi:hypothetical protein
VDGHLLNGMSAETWSDGSGWRGFQVASISSLTKYAGGYETRWVLDSPSRHERAMRSIQLSVLIASP